MLLDAVQHPGPEAEQIDRLTDTFIDFVARRRHYAIMAFRELVDQTFDLEPILREHVYPMLDLVFRYTREGQRKGTLRDADPAIFLLAFVGTILFYFAAAPLVLEDYLDEDPWGSSGSTAERARSRASCGSRSWPDPETPMADSSDNRPSAIFAPDLLADQVALITGGGSGIGLAIAREMGRLGARVAIGSRKADRIEEAARGLEAEGIDCMPLTIDIREPEQVEASVRAVLERWGKIDVLVNNAGGQFPAPAASFSKNGWDAVVRTNLNGTWYVTQEVAKSWMLEHGGKIISIVADMWRGFPGMAHTGAARAGVVNLAMTLAVEWAPFGVLVNCVAPGTID